MLYVSKFRKVYIAVLIVVFIVILGTIGFVSLEGYTLGDALYMTIITISTVGYQEVVPLSESGKFFTILLIITSLGTFAYALSAISSYIIDGEFRRHIYELRKIKKISKLENHVIVCGYGRNGKQIVQELEELKQDYVLIEKNEDEIQDAILNKCRNYIEGDATNDQTLMESGIQKAKALITTLPEDADNVFVVLTAREMSKKLTIISRASRDSSYRKLKTAGANNIVMPDKVGGSHMVSLVMKPDVVEFFNHITGQDENISIEEISYDSLPAEFKNKSIEDLHIRKRSGANIVGLKDKDGKYIINPSPDYIICEGSKVFVLGMKEQIEDLLKWD